MKKIRKLYVGQYVINDQYSMISAYEKIDELVGAVNLLTGEEGALPVIPGAKPRQPGEVEKIIQPLKDFAEIMREEPPKEKDAFGKTLDAYEKYMKEKEWCQHLDEEIKNSKCVDCGLPRNIVRTTSKPELNVEELLNEYAKLSRWLYSFGGTSQEIDNSKLERKQEIIATLKANLR